MGEAKLGPCPLCADDIRALGWSVAVHNDYRLNGEPHTFWLFTKDGRAVKGEGRTDAEALAQVSAALSPAPQSGWRPTHRHVKRGSEYQLLGMGKMQAKDWRAGGKALLYPVDMTAVAIYQAKDGSLWVRPREEFEDGRFAPLPPEPGD